MRRKTLLVVVCVIAVLVLCFVSIGIPEIKDAKNAKLQAELQAESERVKYSPKSPSTTEDNCKIIHSLLKYSEEDFGDREKWDSQYRARTLENFGLKGKEYFLSNSSAYSDFYYRWNGVWIIDEEFIRKYVSMYSADEFFKMYDSFILPLLDISPGKKGEELYGKMSDTTTLLLSMTDLFEVNDFHPTKNQFTKTASEKIPVSGKFNEGRDNHVVTRTSSYTKDSYVYEGYEEYTVIHSYGYKYDPGEYSYKNGVFTDIPSSFQSFSEYALTKNGKYILQEKSSIGELDCSFIENGGKLYTPINVKWNYEAYYGAKTVIYGPYRFLVPNRYKLDSQFSVVK